MKRFSQSIFLAVIAIDSGHCYTIYYGKCSTQLIQSNHLFPLHDQLSVCTHSFPKEVRLIRKTTVFMMSGQRNLCSFFFTFNMLRHYLKENKKTRREQDQINPDVSFRGNQKNQKY